MRMNRKTVAVLAAVLMVGSLAASNQANAKSKFGLNLGVTYLVSSATAGTFASVDGTIGLPLAGLHLIMGGEKGGLSWRNYLEYQPYTSTVTLLGVGVNSTTDNLTLTSLAALNLGKALYLGLGPAIKYGLAASSIGVGGSLALGFNLGSKWFFETRMDVDLSPDGGAGIFDNLFLNFLIGWSLSGK